MQPLRIAPLTLRATIEQWPLLTPFAITGYTWENIEVLVVSLEHEGRVGRGESAGVYYKGDDPGPMLAQIESLRATIEAGCSRDTVQTWLPPGGARNALDCALWDLEAKLRGYPAWQMAGLLKPKPLMATFTCGADGPQEMAAKARSYSSARAIKMKLTGEEVDGARVHAVRDARPEVWLSVDANQGFSREFLDRLMPVLVESRVALVEQPFPVGKEAWLDGLRSPISIAADESVQSFADIPLLVGRFDVVNIKLDKAGGVTEGLAMARAAQAQGLKAMIGNMLGTSLAMAPGYLVGQLCSVVDLDGPILLKRDRSNPVDYTDG